MNSTVYHLTSENNIENINTQGIIPLKSEGLTLEGSWAETIYPSKPTYIWIGEIDDILDKIKLSGYSDHIESPVLIEISIPEDIDLYPDLPTFISDTEAYISDEDDQHGFWWKNGKEPAGLEEYIEEDEDRIIYFDDLMNDELLIKSAIKSIGSAVVCQEIHPDLIKGWKHISPSVNYSLKM